MKDSRLLNTEFFWKEIFKERILSANNFKSFYLSWHFYANGHSMEKRFLYIRANNFFNLQINIVYFCKKKCLSKKWNYSWTFYISSFGITWSYLRETLSLSKITLSKKPKMNIEKLKMFHVIKIIFCKRQKYPETCEGPQKS
jgi:hypothetical protein